MKYIEENEEWLIANRLERSYQEEDRQKMWEKEERLERMSQKIETKREIKNKTKTGPGEEKDGEMHQKAGNYQMDGKAEEQMTGKAWNYWRHKSPLTLRTPALGHIQTQGERDTQGQNLIDSENLQQEQEITS